MEKPIELGYNISLIDLFDLGMNQRTGSYVFHEEELTIIETSASPSLPHLLNGLEEMKIALKKIKYIIVTHIHLDHAGGVGLLLQKCPNAKVVVHQKGYRHLSNPSRLIEGAKAVYGEKFDELFDPILPIPEENLIIKEDGDTLELSEGRTLTFMDTPGHAKHHFSIFDSKSNGVFTGDTVGVYYPQLLLDGVELYLPSTSPNQFSPEAMLQSAKRIEDYGVDRIYFGHYGMSENPDEVFDQLRHWLPKFVEAGKTVIETNPELSFQEKSQLISEKLFDLVSRFLDTKNVSRDAVVYEILNLDLSVCAMGITDYLSKQTLNK
ncbi:MBL fold metallo-hydrolase [Pseudalkalibacillus caeni]|uniref:MBL fold metallo-hydrolase n=1 Tax=Exobacillus caeni TaxID=2574798 RepID=A0A5R9F035_9BACL|nr:MBL fold metallo-hydrolase [Pseudalkalibacillus caeni]TLS36962.1 MBL fold metallo-hydrolase [Pseudalkalibacillus caeni]